MVKMTAFAATLAVLLGLPAAGFAADQAGHQTRIQLAAEDSVSSEAMQQEEEAIGGGDAQDELGVSEEADMLEKADESRE
ncbi:hypothetical protein V6C03_02425 [Methyloligella sp. 2.7D]|uniref:hypothetical protein n=1 Tax=unclassified Methyloligella TaxID=2625955 RepID=UPI00157C997A|nr:hypothetical protein [Methyloligella sp. GL2]QKP76515.1 hypothetical protein HT051_02995 [Methyloligella sp. GL2]